VSPATFDSQTTRLDLMRARDLDDVLLSEGFSTMLSSIGHYPDDPTRLAILGGLLGRVKAEPKLEGYSSLGLFMAKGASSESQGYYPKSRFKRLIDRRNPDHLFRQLCSIADYFDGVLPVTTGDQKGLVGTVLTWPLEDDSTEATDSRQQLAQDYYTNLND